MKIELIYFDGCPNHRKAYQVLQQILREENIYTAVDRIEIKDDVDAARHKFVGSPTIRIDGIDVDPVTDERAYAKTCRVYLVSGKLSGLPARAMIENAIRRAKSEGRGGS